MKNCHDYDHLIIVHIIWLKKPIENVFLLYKQLQVFINVRTYRCAYSEMKFYHDTFGCRTFLHLIFDGT
jgi:hypothetical protein